jgi:hypothetical protein
MGFHAPRWGTLRQGWTSLYWGGNVRGPTTASAIVLVCLLVAGCATTQGHAESPTTTRTMIPRPLVERELDGLLLGHEQVNAAMVATGLADTETDASMSDNSATMAPQECLAIDAAAEATVYAGSGFLAERGQSLNDGDEFTHYVKQAVVLFPLVEKADAFFNASARQWPACHDYVHTQSGSHWSVGQISNINGTLTATATQIDARAPGWRCGRALALRNNVIIDINTCSVDSADSAAKIAEQVAATVTAQW